jgi:hypothetical protein
MLKLTEYKYNRGVKIRLRHLSRGESNWREDFEDGGGHIRAHTGCHSRPAFSTASLPVPVGASRRWERQACLRAGTSGMFTS